MSVEQINILKPSYFDKEYYNEKGLLLNMNHLNVYKLKTIVNTRNKNKKKNTIYNRINKFYDTINFNYNFYILLFIFIIIFPFCLSKDIKLRKLTFTYDITIKINKDGNQSILSDKYTNLPSVIIINNHTQEEKKYIYELQSGTNTIVMKWNSDLGNCNNMFKDLSNIDSIEFSNFEDNNIVELNSMFHGCKSLKSLDFSNFDTSKVAVMNNMFDGCSSLASITFGTDSTKNVNSMSHMFSDCHSLTTIDLTNFETSNAKTMNFMFSGCRLLKELNLEGFNTQNAIDISNMFEGCGSLDIIKFK